MINWAVLTDRGVVAVFGAGSEGFLQGLVTNNVGKLGVGQCQFSGLLSPQGKILFAFFIHRTAEEFLLDVDAASADALAKRLMFYRLRAKLEIENRSEALAVVAAWGGEGENEPPKSIKDLLSSKTKAPVAGPAPDPRFPALGWRMIAAAEAFANVAPTDDPPGATLCSIGGYHLHRLGQGIPEAGIDYALGDAFPHEANWDMLAGVDFRKGCYIGQEVVSRMYHKTAIRSRILPVEGDGSFPPPGTEIRAGDIMIGTLASADGPIGIASMRLDRLARAYERGEKVLAGETEVRLRDQPWMTFETPKPGVVA